MCSDCHLPVELRVVPVVDLHVVLSVRSRFVLNSVSESDQVEVSHISAILPSILSLDK